MNKWIGFGIGALVVGYVAYSVYIPEAPAYAALHSDGKFLGLIDEKGGYSLDDIAKGAVLLGGAALAIRAARMFGLPASTALPV